ncbi:MAG: hypothetical protein QM760_03065 [Nibricoccus sp.]
MKNVAISFCILVTATTGFSQLIIGKNAWEFSSQADSTYVLSYSGPAQVPEGDSVSNAISLAYQDNAFVAAELSNTEKARSLLSAPTLSLRPEIPYNSIPKATDGLQMKSVTRLTAETPHLPFPTTVAAIPELAILSLDEVFF